MKPYIKHKFKVKIPSDEKDELMQIMLEKNLQQEETSSSLNQSQSQSNSQLFSPPHIQPSIDQCNKEQPTINLFDRYQAMLNDHQTSSSLNESQIQSNSHPPSQTNR